MTKTKYYKIFNELDNHHGFQYEDGLNVDTVPFNDDPNRSCVEGGFYFTTAEHILAFTDYGDYIREVEVPEGDLIIKDPDGDKFRAHSLFLHKKHDLRKSSTWKWIIKQGINIQADNNYAIRWASEYGHIEVVKLLLEHGADCTAMNNYAIRWASAYGHLEIVKLLIENGADCTDDNNSAIQLASEYGHIEVVKLLLKNGADCTVDNNYAIQWASRYGHLEVVKLLIENGADCTTDNNQAIRWASANGHIKIVKLLELSWIKIVYNPYVQI